MNDENSLTPGTRPCMALRTFDTKAQTKRTVIMTVPISDSNAAFLRLMVRLYVRLYWDFGVLEIAFAASM